MEFRILGPVQALRDDGPVDLGGARRVALLAALLVRANVTCPADYLIDVLWGDHPPAAASATLQSHIAHLRRVLEPDRSARRPPTILKSVQSGYVLAVAPEDFDAAVFERLLRSGRTALAAGDPRRAIEALDRGLALWRGDALTGFAERDFAAAEAARLEQLRLDAAEARLEALAAAGAHAEVVADAERLLSRQPLRERVWELLLLALYRSGRQGDALAGYQRARGLLVEQLGVEPRPSLRELEQRILHQDPALDRPSVPAPREPTDDAAPLQVPAGAPGQPVRPALPTPLTSFVGRTAERAQLALALSQHRLVTAVGAGGVGKSRLALAVAEDVAGRFADGVCFVDLGAVTEPGRVAAVVAARLGIGETARHSVEEAVLAELAGRQTLLVVDNCEHLLDGVTPFAERLLQACPRVVILTTSRARLMVPFERVFPVPGLSLPSDETAGDAVALFAERALAAGGGGLTSDDERRRVRTICEALEGHALAIELAAARLPALGLAGLEAGLTDHLRLLAGGPRAQGRHRSLRAALEWSEALLAEPDRALLRRVAVFLSPFTMQAAGEVTDFPPIEPGAVADGLARLTEQSLLVRLPGGAGPRYRMQETLRQYGRERLAAAGELETVRDRHLRWSLTTAACTALAAGEDLAAWARSFDRVADDLRDALGWAAATWPAGPAHRRAEAAELATRFAGLAFTRGLLSEAQQRYELAAQLEEDCAGAAAALRNAAGAAFCRIFGAETVRLLEAAAEVSRKAGQPVAAAQDLAAAAVVIARHRGVFPTPVPPEVPAGLMARAAELAPDAPLVEASRLMIEVFQGDKGRHRIPTAERAVALAHEAGDPLAESAALDALTENYLAVTDLDAASRLARRRVDLLDPLPLHAAVGAEQLDALHVVCEVSLVAGDLISARRWAQRFCDLPFMSQQEHVATNRLMVIDALAGTWSDLLTASERYRDGWERGGRPRGLILARGAAAVALVLGLRGDWAARDEWLSIVADHGLPADPRARLDTGWAPTFDAILLLHHGQAAEAAARLAVDPAELRTPGGAAWRKWYAALWAEAAVLAGRDSDGRVERSRAFADGNPVAAAIVERAAGVLAGDRNRILAAAAVLDGTGCRYQWARTLVLAGGGERREGEAALRAMGAASP